MNPIPVAMPDLSGNEQRYVAECLQSTWISSQGRFIGEFEEKFARYCDVDHAVAACNGTAALHLLLTALGVGPGDEVLVPTLSFVATANAVCHCGGRPVFVDIDPATLNIAAGEIEAKITPRTKGIIAVHLYGHVADMARITRIAERYHLFVVEDAAEAHGARYHGKPVGGLGTAAIFSFYGNKIITTGEGGMVTTGDAALAERVLLLRGQGMAPDRRYWHPIIGFNYRMTNIAAALGLAQLEQIENFLQRRARAAEWYRQELVPLKQFLRQIEPADWEQPVPWMETILLNQGGCGERDQVMAELSRQHIETRPLFYPIHTLPPYANTTGDFPNAVDCAARGINLPMFATITRDQVARVCQALRQALHTVFG